jgi:hypothetical protein
LFLPSSASGDTINHAVFTPQELRRGLSKLTRAEYVIDDAGLYSLLPRGRALVAEARAKCSNWLSMWQGLEKTLGATSGPENAPRNENRMSSDPLTDDAVAGADAEYRAKFAQLLAAIEGEDP